MIPAGVIVSTLVVAALAGWPITALVLRWARVRTSSVTTGHQGRDLLVLGSAPVVEASQVLRGGTWIGVLERLAVAACVLAGEPALIAIVVAVKGLGRYPELAAHPQVTERFIIGTMASMLLAVGCGALGVVALGRLG